LQLLAGKLGDEAHDFEGGRGLRSGNVDGDVGGLCRKGRRIGARHIAHMHEVLGFRAIADHTRPFTPTHAVMRFNDVERGGRAVVLAFAVYGCIAHDHVIETALRWASRQSCSPMILLAPYRMAAGGALAEWKGVLSSSLPTIPGP